MLNWIWGIMIIAGTVYGILTGNTEEVSEGIMEGAGEGVSLAITMAGVLGLWCGLMEIAQKSGLLTSLSKILRPFICFLFPNIPKGHPSLEYISVNFVANMFGVAGAATPSGLKAMEYLEELEEEREKKGKRSERAERIGIIERNGENKRIDKTKRSREDKRIDKTERSREDKRIDKMEGSGENKKIEKTASAEMCTFLIVNVSSLQLIPINMVAYRSQYGSVNASAIVAPALIATFISTIIGIVFCKIMCRRDVSS